MTKGLVTDHYEPEYYKVPKLLTENIVNEYPTFLVIGDTQADWCVRQNFLRRHNWATWKMAIFPFYEFYLLGWGMYGTFNRLRNVPDAGLETRYIMTEALYKEAKQIDADFILNLGDICLNDGRRPKHWQGFLDVSKVQFPLVNEIPYLPVPGNHDRTGDSTYGAPNYNAVFDYPRFYTQEFANAILIVLDSNIIIDWPDDITNIVQDDLFAEWFVSDDPRDPAWLEQQLAHTDKKFKIIAMHHPLLTFGYHHRDWDKVSFGNNLKQKQKQLISLFKRHGVQLVLSGHEHVYQHNILSYHEGKKDGEMHLLTSSSGGVPLRDLQMADEVFQWHFDYHKQGYDIKLMRLESKLHYCQVTIEEEKIQVTTYEVIQDDGVRKQLMEEIEIAQ